MRMIKEKAELLKRSWELSTPFQSSLCAGYNTIYSALHIESDILKVTKEVVVAIFVFLGKNLMIRCEKNVS